MQELKKFLQDSSFSEKEIAVFLAMLKLGPSTVQTIAQKAGINRATTYIVIDNLANKGLILETNKGKKTLFALESPKKLKTNLQQEIEEMQKRQIELDKLLPSFLALFHSYNSNKPFVEFYAGENGLKKIRDLLLNSQSEILNFHALDENLIKLSKIQEEKRFE